MPKPITKTLVIHVDLFDQAIKNYLDRVKENVLLLVKPHMIWDIYADAINAAGPELIKTQTKNTRAHKSSTKLVTARNLREEIIRHLGLPLPLG